MGVTLEAYMGITRYPLPQNNGNLPLPFFVVNTQLFSFIICNVYCYVY